MGVLRIRSSARVLNPAPAGFRILSALDQLAASLPRDIDITSGDEGDDWRAATDPHQTREAYDISIKTWSEAQIVLAYRFLARTLGAKFTVLFEVPPGLVAGLSQPLKDIAYVNAKATGIHFHCQRRKGLVFP